jgi:phosphatidylglycerophosphatase A
MTNPQDQSVQPGSLNTDPPFKPRRTTWAWVIATFFGAGYWRPGPGTAGSLAAAAIWLAVGKIAGHHLSMLAFSWLTATAALGFLAVGIPAATIVARESGRKDPQFVVADEAVGQWITLFAAPVQWSYALLALILFRIFDVWKPFPIRKIEHLPEGWGIMFDDVAAGVYAMATVQLIRHWVS